MRLNHKSLLLHQPVESIRLSLREEEDRHYSLASRVEVEAK